jgi:hypothetical protein
MEKKPKINEDKNGNKNKIFYQVMYSGMFWQQLMEVWVAHHIF